MLVLAPIFKLAEVSFLVWPFILLVDLLAIALAVLTAALWPVLAVLLLTLAAIGALIFKIPADLTGLPAFLFLLGAFVVFFVAASIWIVRKFKPDALKTGIQFDHEPATPGEVAAILPACSVVLPFLLLIMATLRLPLAEPVAGVRPGPAAGGFAAGRDKTIFARLDARHRPGVRDRAGMRVAFQPFRSRRIQICRSMPCWRGIWCSLPCSRCFRFCFCGKFANKTAPWAAAAMAGPLQFFLIHRFIEAVYPNCTFMGLLPAAFAIPGLLSLAVVLKKIAAEEQIPPGATRLVRRCGAVFHHADFSDSIRAAMDHHRLGAGRGGVAVAVSSRAASGLAAHGPRPAGGGVCPARAQSCRAGLSCARCHADLQLVSLRLRHRDGLPVRRGKTSGPAAQYRLPIPMRNPFSPDSGPCWRFFC